MYLYTYSITLRFSLHRHTLSSQSPPSRGGIDFPLVCRIDKIPQVSSLQTHILLDFLVVVEATFIPFETTIKVRGCILWHFPGEGDAFIAAFINLHQIRTENEQLRGENESVEKYVYFK